MISSLQFERIFDFIIYTIPNMFIDFFGWLFTPVRSVVGETIYNTIKIAMNALPGGSWAWNNVYDPMFNLGFISLFSASSLVVIVIFKLLDLLIPF